MRSPPRLPFPAVLVVIALCAMLTGCATTEQGMTCLPESRICIDWQGTPPAGPVVIISQAQVGVTAKPVGLDILNPAAALSASDIAAGTGGVAKDGGGSNVQQPVADTSKRDTPPNPPVARAGPKPVAAEGQAQPDKIGNEAPVTDAKEDAAATPGGQ